VCVVRVCSAIMGTGKSSAAITFLNEHPEQKCIYITPYLEEAARVRKGCPGRKFVEPNNKLSEYNFKKTTHTAALIKKGCNITTTHQAFKSYTPEMLDDIREQGYVLIIDENVDVLEKFECHPDDLQIAIDAGYIKYENNVYSIVNDKYHGTALSELFRFLKSRELIRMDTGEGDNLYYWALPPDLITAFKDVYILTYLFEGQSLHHFLKIYNIPYEYIGVKKSEDGVYSFSDTEFYVPEYVKNISNMIHVLDNERMNEIGNGKFALSMNWFKKNGRQIEQLQKNIANYFNNIWRDVPRDKKLWGCYKNEHTKIQGKGYTRNFLSFNTKATNNYRDKYCLVYAVNIFMNIAEESFYKAHGTTIDTDAYATSVMVQWIWRSAIRDGKEIYIYIPSKRMRMLLNKWIESLGSEGGETIGL